jgi:hypothetical protein
MYSDLHGENVFFKTSPYFSRRDFSKKVRADWQVPVILSEFSTTASERKREWCLALSPDERVSVVYSLLYKELQLSWREGVTVYCENDATNMYFAPPVSQCIGPLYKQFFDPTDEILYLSFNKTKLL